MSCENHVTTDNLEIKSESDLGMRLENLFMQNSVNYDSKLLPSDEKLFSRRKQGHLI